MLRWCAFFIGVCLSASVTARADTPTPSSLTSEQEAKFTTLFEMAERARSGGRINEAAILYEEALDIQFHSVLAGRFGLMLAKLGQVDQAAQMLHEAVTRGQGVSASERRDVLAAYDKARAATTWVNVTISQSGAQVTYDGKPFDTKGFSSFWRFAMPGEHTLRAKLDGYEDAVETFTAKAGEEITVTLKFVPIAGSKLPELPSPIATFPPEKRTFPPYLPTSNTAGASDYDPKEDPSYGEPKDTKPVPKKTGPRFSVNGGVVTVFGVASWNPAVGAVVGVGLRPSDYFSVGVEGRAAWLTTRVADSAINAMTAGGLLSLCGHVKWFFACPLGHLGVIRVEGMASTFGETSFNNFRPGFGGRLGVRVQPSDRLSLQATADALALTYRTRILVGNETIVDQPAAMVSAQITGGWEF